MPIIACRCRLRFTVIIPRLRGDPSITIFDTYLRPIFRRTMIIYLLQTTAIIECMITNQSDTAANHHVCQAPAIIERIHINRSNPVTNHHACQIVAISKRVLFNARHTVRNHYAHQIVAIRERRAYNHLRLGMNGVAAIIFAL